MWALSFCGLDLTPPPIPDKMTIEGVLWKYLHKCGAALKELVPRRVSPYKASQGPYWQPQRCGLLRTFFYRVSQLARPYLIGLPIGKTYLIGLPIGETNFRVSLLARLFFWVPIGNPIILLRFHLLFRFISFDFSFET